MKLKIPHEIEFTKLHFGIIAIIALLCFGYEKIGSETLTLHAYYPSPVGIYTRLVSLNKATFARERGDVVLTGENNSGGKVGIGTKNPQAKLDVVGDINIQAPASGPASGLILPLVAAAVAGVGCSPAGKIVYGSGEKIYLCGSAKTWKELGGGGAAALAGISFFNLNIAWNYTCDTGCSWYAGKCLAAFAMDNNLMNTEVNVLRSAMSCSSYGGSNAVYTNNCICYK